MSNIEFSLDIGIIYNSSIKLFPIISNLKIKIIWISMLDTRITYFAVIED